MSVSTVPGYLTVSEAARAANVSKNTIRREITAGHLAPCRIGRVLRILDEELARWMRANQSSPPAVNRSASGVTSVPALDGQTAGGESPSP